MILGNSEKFSVRIDNRKKDIYNLVKQEMQGAYK
jgi:hypothetical protein